MKTSICKHTFSLYPNKLLILLDFQFTISSFSSQLDSILSPLGELGLAHFLFHEASVVLLVSTVVDFPYRIILYLFLEVVTHSIVAAGFRRITAYQAFAVVRKRCMLHDEPASAVAALDWHVFLLNAFKQLKIQKGSQRCETISLTEYGTFFRFEKRMSHAHTAT